jgi:hypothetical protein
VKLLDRTGAAARAVRLLGVTVHNLEDPSAPFDPEEPLLPFEACDADQPSCSLPSIAPRLPTSRA